MFTLGIVDTYHTSMFDIPHIDLSSVIDGENTPGKDEVGSNKTSISHFHNYAPSEDMRWLLSPGHGSAH